MRKPSNTGDDGTLQDNEIDKLSPNDVQGLYDLAGKRGADGKPVLPGIPDTGKTLKRPPDTGDDDNLSSKRFKFW